MSNIAFIPARGGSKGVKKKNIIDFGGRPLIHYTIEAALASNQFDSVIISTDCEKIAKISLDYSKDIEIHERSTTLSADSTPIIDVMNNYIKGQSLDSNINNNMTLLQCTSPFRNFIDIQKAFDLWKAHKPETLVSITAVPHSMIPEVIYKKTNHYLSPYVTEQIQSTQRQNKPKYFARNGPAIVIAKIQNILSGKLYKQPLIGYEMSFLKSFDIDTYEDLSISRKLLDLLE